MNNLTIILILIAVIPGALITYYICQKKGDVVLSNSTREKRASDVSDMLVYDFQLNVGKETVMEMPSSRKPFAVVFEDDGATGYLYGLNQSIEEDPILDALHVYDVESVVDKERESIVQVIWTCDGLKVLLVINEIPHAAFDFEAKRGYCKSGFPPSDTNWTKFGHKWDDAVLENWAEMIN